MESNKCDITELHPLTQLAAALVCERQGVTASDTQPPALSIPTSTVRTETAWVGKDKNTHSGMFGEQTRIVSNISMLCLSVERLKIRQIGKCMEIAILKRKHFF